MRNRLLPLALLGLALLAGGGLWLGAFAGEKREHAAARPAAPAPGPAVGPMEEPAPVGERSADIPVDAGAAEDLASPWSSTAGPTRIAASTGRDAELARALWVEGQVVLPPGTPAGEQVQVIANGRRFEHGPLHAAALDANGSFRVAFAEETKTGHLELKSRYLYLDEPPRISPAAGEAVVLEARLGATLRGRVLPPAGSQGAQALIGKRVTLRGSHPRLQVVTRSTRLDASLTFAFHGLPPDLEYRLSCDPLVYAPCRVDDLSLTPGLEAVHDLELRAGVLLAGHVVDQAGAPVAGVQVRARAHDDAWSGSMRKSRTDARGAFDLRAVPPGSIDLLISAAGYLPLVHELGQVEDGAERRGLTLELDHGMSISGRVLWPDGTPAADVSVTAQPLKRLRHGSPGDQSCRSDGAGGFTITGLRAEPHDVVASATQEEVVSERSKILDRDRTKTVRKTLRATQGPVEAGATGLVLEFSRGETLRGVVVDALGVPVEEFRVSFSAVHQGSGRTFDRRSKSFKDAGGVFAVHGLARGTYELWVAADDHLASDPIRLELPMPGELAPIRLVRATRLAGIVLDAEGEPVAHARVERAPWIPDGEGPPEFDVLCWTDEEGRFHKDDVEPGRYKVRGAHAVFPLSETLDVTLATGSSEIVTLRLRPGARLTGLVLDRNGEALPGRRVEITRSRGIVVLTGDYDAVVASDERGAFELAGVEPGTYTVVALPTHAELAELGVSPSAGARDALCTKAEVKVTESGGHVVLRTRMVEATR